MSQQVNIAPNLELSSRAVVRSYNRGTAEQWIKKGKLAGDWTVFPVIGCGERSAFVVERGRP